MTGRNELAREFKRIASSEEQLDLASAALLIAADEYPGLDVPAQLKALDALGRVAAIRVGQDRDPLYCMNALSEYLFDEVGFKGNVDDYYDPRNSYVNDVLTRRLGIPITLSLVYIEVGRRLDVPLVGVGMPGHFLVKHVEVDDLFVDPFHNGMLLSKQECIERLNTTGPGDAEWREDYVTPISNRDFIARMLRNLKTIYWQRQEYGRSLTTLDWLLEIRPEPNRDLRDRGVVHYKLGNYDEALSDLQRYVGSQPTDPKLGEVEKLLARIKDRQS